MQLVINVSTCVRILPSRAQIVKDYERAVILRLGRLVSKKAKGPGLFFVLPCIDDVRVVNLRTVTFDVPPQEVSADVPVIPSFNSSVQLTVFIAIWV